jgi:hypothetical protein
MVALNGFDMNQIRRAAYRLPNAKEDFLRKALSLAFDVRVDQLDCSVSWTRQPTDKTIEEVLQLCLAAKNSHYVCILRDERDYVTGKMYYDIGASTMNTQDTDYFLWINIDMEPAEKLIKEFNLERLQ